MNAKEKSRFDRLYQKHLTALKLHGFAQKTIDAYARAPRRVVATTGRSPDRLSKNHLNRYFANLVDSHSWSTVRLDRNGLRVFFEDLIGKPMPWLDLIKPPTVRNLPDILTHDEIARIILATEQPRYRTFWCVTYSMGLRLSEALNLQVGDIDGQRMRIHVRRGKGNKDRFVVLPDFTYRVLRRHWASHRHPRFIFPGHASPFGDPAPVVMDRGGTQSAFRRVVAHCQITKRVSIHSLRHAYATHLIEAGLHLRGIQEQLGHADPKTTARYARLTDKSRGDGAELINTMVNHFERTLRQAARG